MDFGEIMKFFKELMKKIERSSGITDVCITLSCVLIGGAVSFNGGPVRIAIGAVIGFLVGGVISTIVIDKARGYIVKEILSKDPNSVKNDLNSIRTS
jgi:hypothetical protein